MIGTATIAIALLCILSDLTMITMLVHEHLTKTTGRAGGQRGHLLDLLADGGAVAAKMRPRLLAISEERERVKYELAEQEPLAKRARH